MAQGMDEENEGMKQGVLRLSISPEPTPDERDAIVAALTTLLMAAANVAQKTDMQPPVSRWGHAGHIAAMGGITGSPVRDWGQRSP